MLLHSEARKSTFKFIDAVTYIMPALAREAYRILTEICSFWRSMKSQVRLKLLSNVRNLHLPNALKIIRRLRLQDKRVLNILNASLRFAKRRFDSKEN